MTSRTITRCVLCLVSGLTLAGDGNGQFPPRPINPYNPYNPFGTTVVGGGQLFGTADVIRATGELNINQEKARIEREKANQAKYDTRKKALDQMNYEKANTPTAVEEHVFVANQTVIRMMNSPQPAEIAKGKTLNTFLPFVDQLSNQGVQGPPAPLNPEALKRVNVTTGPGGPDIGLLKKTPFDWPLALRGPKQAKFDALLTQAVSLATQGQLTAAQHKELVRLSKEIQDDFTKAFGREEVSTSDYLVATPFLESLQNSVRALGQPGIRRLLDGSYSARGGNVPELVWNMSSNGLTFAPAAPGDEPAYRAMHDAFTGYIRRAQASTGFQMPVRPTLPSHLTQK